MLKEERLKKKLTQEEIARKINTSLRTYQNIEKRNDCNVKKALKIAKILNEPIEKIFAEEKK